MSFALLPSFLANALLVTAMVRDWRRHGRPNPAYWIGAGIVAVQIVRIPLSVTTMWHSVTTWLLSLGG